MTPSIISLLQNGIELGEEFCNDPQGNEWHALGLGIISIFDREPFDKNKIPDSYPDELKAAIISEYHYFRLGRVIGIGVAGLVALVALRYGVSLTF